MLNRSNWPKVSLGFVVYLLSILEKLRLAFLSISPHRIGPQGPPSIHTPGTHWRMVLKAEAILKINDFCTVLRFAIINMVAIIKSFFSCLGLCLGCFWRWDYLENSEAVLKETKFKEVTKFPEAEKNGWEEIEGQCLLWTILQTRKKRKFCHHLLSLSFFFHTLTDAACFRKSESVCVTSEGCHNVSSIRSWQMSCSHADWSTDR